MSDADDLGRLVQETLALDKVTGTGTATLKARAQWKSESEQTRGEIIAANRERLAEGGVEIAEGALEVANATARLQEGMIDDYTKDMMETITKIERYYDDFRPGKAAPERRAEIADEINVPPAAAREPISSSSALALTTPRPLDSSNFLILRDEYIRFFLRAEIRPTKASYVCEQADMALENRARYEDVGAPHGIPWWFIAGIHMMESNFSFDGHLHNGDPLSDRTQNHPPGRPKNWGPSSTWEDSAADALTGTSYIGFGGQTDWSLPRALWRWEKYNGFGYRDNYTPTPYLWGHTTIYLQGRFTRDGVFDAGATSVQCGVAALLKELHARQEVNLEIEVSAPDDGDAPGAPAPLLAQPVLAVENDFVKFFAAKLPEIGDFTAAEFLYRGGLDASLNLNSAPPRELWPNIINSARLLQAFRDRLTDRYPGARVRLTSIYRNAPYNEAVGGAPESRHRAFNAVDFQAFGAPAGGPRDWFEIIEALQSETADFIGGLAAYGSFVHADTRGVKARWNTGA